MHKKKNYELKQWIDSYIVNDYNLLHQQSFGLIFFSKNTNIINISSTKIRKNYFHGKSNCKYLPKKVEKYILFKKLYSKKPFY